MTPRESNSVTTVNTFNGRAEGAGITVEADYKLTPIGGGNAIAEGRVVELVTYDRTSQRLSNVRAARDAEIRNAKVLADQIRIRLAVALANRG